VRYRVLEAILGPNGEVLIEKGAPAYGTVLAARGAGAWGRKGKLSFNVETALAVDSTEVSTRVSQDKSGSTAAGGFIGNALLFGVLGGFVRGKNAKLAAGTELVAFVDRDTWVMPRGAAPATDTAAQLVATTEAAKSATPVIVAQPLIVTVEAILPDTGVGDRVAVFTVRNPNEGLIVYRASLTVAARDASGAVVGMNEDWDAESPTGMIFCVGPNETRTFVKHFNAHAAFERVDPQVLSGFVPFEGPFNSGLTFGAVTRFGQSVVGEVKNGGEIQADVEVSAVVRDESGKVINAGVTIVMRLGAGESRPFALELMTGAEGKMDLTVSPSRLKGLPDK